MNAADVMTKTVVTISAKAALADALRLMLGQRISGLPVVDGTGKLVGILTEGDLLRRSEIGTEKQRPGWMEFLRGPGREAEEYVHTHARTVGEVMTPEVVTAPGTASLEEVVGLMERKHVKRVPIVDGGRLVGLVSRADLLRVLALELGKAGPVSVSDVGIREQVETQLHELPWFKGNRVDTVVTDGVVTLEGVIFDEREHEAIRVVAENVAGVKRVDDHIAYLNLDYVAAYGTFPS